MRGARRCLFLALAGAMSLGVAWAGVEVAPVPKPGARQAVLRLDPRYLRLASLGFRELSADLCWVQAGVAYGEGVRRRKVDTEAVAALIDQAVELDPQYYDAYWYGATLLPPEQANELLKRGLKRFPNDWKLPEMIGFNYHVYLRDQRRAAEFYELAATKPGHPPYVPSLAGRLYTESDDIDAAIRVLQNFYEACDREPLKGDFARRIEQLWNIKLLTEGCGEFRRWYQRPPQGLEELVEVGILHELPPDPFGGHYSLGPEGRVVCDRDQNHLKG